MSGNLQVPWWKSGVTSHSNNWLIWCSPWGGDALQCLIQLVATPDTDWYFWFWPPICSGTHYSIFVSHMFVELVQFMSQLLNLVMFIQIFTHVKFAKKLTQLTVRGRYSQKVKRLDTPTLSRFFLYLYYFLQCRIIVKTSKLWNNTYGIM
jgi:hypothetical protein